MVGIEERIDALLIDIEVAGKECIEGVANIYKARNESHSSLKEIVLDCIDKFLVYTQKVEALDEALEHYGIALVEGELARLLYITNLVAERTSPFRNI